MFDTRRLAALSVALFVVLSLSACGGADSRRATHMERGQKYFASGNLEKARVEFRNALQITPKDAEARYMNGRVAEQLGDLRGAAGMYQGAIDADADHLQARANLGRMLVFAGAPERALEVIEPSLTKHPEDPDLLTVRGAARVQLKDTMGALADAEFAVGKRPDSESAVALLAALYRQTGENEKAIELVRGFLEKRPDSIDLRQVLASLYFAGKQPDLAEQQLAKIVEQRPKELRYRMQLALQYLRAKKTDEAEKVMAAAVKAVPESHEAKLAYAEFLASQGARERGEQALKGYIEREPTNFDLQLGLGAFQQRFEADDAALATYARIVERDGEGPAALSARNRIAAIHARRGEYDKALQLANSTLAKSPRDNDALLLRGNIALERRDATSAIADLRAVLRDQPGATGVLRTLARAHLSNGEPALAEEAIRQAVDFAPGDVSVRVELAQLLLQTNRAEQAVTLLEEVVKNAPTDVAAREALARAYIRANDLDAARVAAEDLKLTAPKAASGPYLAGMVAQAQKREADAYENFSRALELQPDAMDTLAAITRLDWGRGQRERALKRVNAAIAADPKNAVTHNLLGEMHLSDKSYAAAIDPLIEATKLAPQWWLPYRNLAAAHLGKGALAAGIATFEAGVAATKREPVLVSDLAALYEREGRSEEAIRQYEALHEQNPRLELAANNLAMLLVTHRKDRASLDRARELTQAFAQSDNGPLLDTHGWVRFKLGEFTEALPVLERAAVRAPQSRVIRYHLAMAQIKTGQPEKARDNLEHALAGTATFTGADEARVALASLQSPSG